ncbi:hypothetical protein K388_05544 [Streptomyces sp. KhCrAH-43]|uniref:hypothetical protein n=1 Tax=unclassified Streptomyces TaxID=2593676 RepID=UPI000378E6A8|nr:MULTISPECIES: hypothetical protein [unclassified Streptomyces]MYX67395.1 hypothetical protein [Streptomyces sp. SID8373]RAJ53757.1 hypothetical protein K388_05544 [Streptomyces sp. KhCrAH-43]
MSPYLISGSALAVLSDADGATVSDLATKRRASITVAQAEQAAAVADPDRLAVSLLSEFRAAWSTGNTDRMSDVILAAVDLDHTNPGAPRLMDEIRGLSTPAAA